MKRLGFFKMAAAMMAVVMLLLTPAVSLADVTVTNEVTFERSITLNKATDTYINRVDGEYALYDAEGNKLSDGYSYMSDKEGGLFQEVYTTYDTVNSYGLLDRDGQMLIPMQYGKIDVLSEKWILGIVLEETEEEPYDYRALFGGGLFRVLNVDVYFEGQMIGSLERADFADASVTANGSFLAVRKVDRSGYYLNSSFERTDVSEDDFSYREYDEVYGKGVFHRATGQQAFVDTCTLTPDEVEQSVWYNTDGNFVDLQGNVIAAGPEAKYDSVGYYGGNYLRLRRDGKYGLADLQGNEILAPVYDGMGGGVGGVFYESGYQAVMKDGKLSYIDLEGNVTVTLDYEMSESDFSGFIYNAPFVTFKERSKIVVVTAVAGELEETYDEAAMPRESLKVLAVKQGDLWGVIDLEGNVVIPFEYKYQPDISLDGTLVLGNVDGTYVLRTLSYGE